MGMKRSVAANLRWADGSAVGSQKQLCRRSCGQMTVELAVTMPVLIIVAVIAVNALTFLGDCAAFDRIAHGAVRVHASSLAYGQDASQSAALVEQEIRAAMGRDNLEVSVSRAGTGADFDEYRARLSYSPTLFGMGLRSEVFGVSLPELVHETSYVVDVYKPGVIL